MAEMPHSKPHSWFRQIWNGGELPGHGVNVLADAGNRINF